MQTGAETVIFLCELEWQFQWCFGLFCKKAKWQQRWILAGIQESGLIGRDTRTINGLKSLTESQFEPVVYETNQVGLLNGISL